MVARYSKAKHDDKLVTYINDHYDGNVPKGGGSGAKLSKIADHLGLRYASIKTALKRLLQVEPSPFKQNDAPRPRSPPPSTFEPSPLPPPLPQQL
jgi:hypothetical protein